jgi:hypothetical protein
MSRVHRLALTLALQPASGPVLGPACVCDCDGGGARCASALCGSCAPSTGLGGCAWKLRLRPGTRGRARRRSATPAPAGVDSASRGGRMAIAKPECGVVEEGARWEGKMPRGRCGASTAAPRAPHGTSAETPTVSHALKPRQGLILIGPTAARCAAAEALFFSAPAQHHGSSQAATIVPLRRPRCILTLDHYHLNTPGQAYNHERTRHRRLCARAPRRPPGLLPEPHLLRVRGLPCSPCACMR